MALSKLTAVWDYDRFRSFKCWDGSSVGRAEDWKSSCRRFDSVSDHLKPLQKCWGFLLTLNMKKTYVIYIVWLILVIIWNFSQQIDLIVSYLRLQILFWFQMKLSPFQSWKDYLRKLLSKVHQDASPTQVHNSLQVWVAWKGLLATIIYQTS